MENFLPIINGEIPSVKIYEDNKCVVILDINPVVKGHCLIIPKEVYPTIAECPDELLNHLMGVVKLVDAKLRKVLACEATNIFINNGPAAGQEIPHLHIHVVPRFIDDGKKVQQIHDKYSEGEMFILGRALKI